VLLMDSIGAVSVRAQAERDKLFYEDRLDALSAERDGRAAEAVAAQERFALAVRQVSAMQSELLASEAERRELETGLGVVHASLGRAMAERDAAAALAATEAAAPAASMGELAGTVDLLAGTLAETAAERDAAASEAEEAVTLAGDLDLEIRLMEERNGEIFRQIEEAMKVSVEPLDAMFRTVGMDPDKLMDEVRSGYEGQGGPLTPFTVSAMNSGRTDAGAARANDILDELDRINLYRIALQRVPFAMPVRDPFRYTSQFGPRWGRMHEGVDMAAPNGTPIYATADGVVTFAGWSGGYGQIIKVQHEFGIETRYPHLSSIGVEVGQRVSRGDRIGGMGSTGRSTGSHLHYEVRVNGEAINPMIYIGAGDDVL
jgi:murein DD-endopeptidase MepM/ murein hydrolase activator NlpD